MFFVFVVGFVFVFTDFRERGGRRERVTLMYERNID